MTTSLALHARPIAFEVHALLRELDPARFRADMEATIMERSAALSAALTELLEMSMEEEQLVRLEAGIRELEELVRTHLEELPSPSEGARQASDRVREEWVQFGQRLRPAYEGLRQVLDAADVHVPSLRPTNYKRNILHFSSSFIALALIMGVPSIHWLQVIGVVFTVYAWSMEFFRRRYPALNDHLMRLYGGVAHPHEWSRVNSATWYSTALFGLTLTGSLEACTSAVLVLGAGDPAAALIGRRWGRTKLIHGRSLEGSLAFVAAGGLFCAIGLALCFPAFGMPLILALAFASSFVGAIAELFSRRLDDNLTIPICAGATTWLLLLSLL